MKIRSTIYIFFLPLVILFISAGISEIEEPTSKNTTFDIAVFIPGIVDGSPVYEMLAEGVERAVSESEAATVKIIEGGFNQSEWKEQIIALASEEEWDLIISSNPAIPEICNEVSKIFPYQKFLVLDGNYSGNSSIYTLQYNQREQAYLNGYMAGLITTSALDGANSELRVGLLAGQEYPVMNNIIIPGFTEGVKTINQDIEIDVRYLGNWYDATKAAEITRNMVKNGADVVLTIAGGGSQGVVTAAIETGTYVLWFDDNGYSIAPGTVLGSAVILQDKAAYNLTKKAIADELEYGKAEIVNVKDGYVDFILNDKNLTDYLPDEIFAAQTALLEKLRSGELDLSIKN